MPEPAVPAAPGPAAATAAAAAEKEAAPAAATEATTVPDGFRPLVTGGPYFRALGPMYIRPLPEGGGVIALHLAESHLNVQGFAHGGMLTTLADGAFGINIAMRRGKRGAQVTVSLTADFLASPRLGDWLEAHVSITRMGQRLAYARCELKVGERHVLSSSAVFAFVDRPLAVPIAGSEAPLNDG